MCLPNITSLVEISTILKQICTQIDDTIGFDDGDGHTLVQTDDYPTLKLDTPRSSRLITKLTNLGASSHLASEISEIHIARAKELARHYSALYERSCTEICRIYSVSNRQRRISLLSRFQKIGELYRNTLRRWEKEYQSLMKERIRTSKHEKSNSFNQVSFFYLLGIPSGPIIP